MKIIVQFGGTGDLAKQKLYPAYSELYKKEYDFFVIALGRRYQTEEDFMKDMIHSDKIDSNFKKRLKYINYDINDATQNNDIIECIKSITKDNSLCKNNVELIYYFALLPELYGKAIESVKEINKSLNNPSKKIVVEKPFGFDLESSEAYNKILNKEFSDEEIYRVDHYLGKEFVQNILVMRFYNDIIQSIWNKNYIDHIQIILNETAGVDQRLGFYEKIGVVRDMVQNHILQIVTHLTMSEPSDFTQEEISHEKLKVLKSMRKIDEFVLAKYKSLGKNEEREINTPTFAALKLYVDNFDFSGVPIYVMTGKKQGCKCSTIYVKFRNFKTKSERKGNVGDNAMIITMQPDMSIDLSLNMKKPSETWKSESIKLNFNHADTFKINTPEAYQQIVEKIFQSDKTLFPCHSEIKESWEIVGKMLTEKKISTYEDGEKPETAEEFIRKDKKEWFI